MLKKLAVFVTMLALVVVGSIAPFSGVSEGAGVRVMINGQQLDLDVAPVIQFGRVMVPFRALFEAFGATVSWTEATSTVTGQLGATTISLRLGQGTATVGERSVSLDVAPFVLNGRTLVPLRFVAENLGAEVEWVEQTQTVIVNTPVVRAERQILTVGLVSDPFMERWGFFGGIGPYDSGGIFETLVYLTTDMKVRPGLALSWENIEPRTWRFRLRPGVRFHSGRAMDATAVKESIDAFVSDRTLNPTFLQIESVTVVNPLTVDFRTRIPFPAFAEQMSHPLIVIANLQHRNAQGAVLPDGTGPFRYHSHMVGRELITVRNDNYWGRKPALERINFRIIPDHTTRMLALRAGEVDIAASVPMADVAGLTADRRINVFRVPITQVRHLTFTLFREPVNDLRVRQAIAHAVDTKAIVDSVLLGIGGIQATTMIIPQMPWSISRQTAAHAFDVARARALLAEAGWTDTNRDGIVDRNGQPMRIRLLVSSVAESGGPISEAVQRMLRNVGIDLSIVVMERAAFWTATDSGEFDMVLTHNVIASATGEILLRRAHVDDANNRIARIYWMGPEMDALIDRATSTFNINQRNELYREIQRRFHQQVVSVPINYMVGFVAAGAHVRRHDPHSSGWSQRYDNVIIARR